MRSKSIFHSSVTSFSPVRVLPSIKRVYGDASTLRSLASNWGSDIVTLISFGVS